jgi:hypothetical protein
MTDGFAAHSGPPLANPVTYARCLVGTLALDCHRILLLDDLHVVNLIRPSASRAESPALAASISRLDKPPTNL